MKKSDVLPALFLLPLAYASSFFNPHLNLLGYNLKFHGVGLILPVLGMFLGIRRSAIFSTSIWSCKWLCISMPITLGVPTFFSMMSLSLLEKENKALDFFIHFFLPMAGITLFLIHPVGRLAPVYPFYWMIPMGIYLFGKNKNVFLSAISSTFIAHCVGSLIWLYTLETTSVYWIGLLPVVAIERLTSSMGIAFVILATNLSVKASRIAYVEIKNLLSTNATRVQNV